MTGLEIGVLLAGLVFIVASFFLGSHGEAAGDSGGETAAAIMKIKEAAVFQETELKQKVQQIVEEKSQEAINDTESKLERISNDKIMAIDEYAAQVLQKIENNNQEVIFLYDMFQKKEEEMKSTMNKMEQTRRENKELFDRLEELKKAKARAQKTGTATGKAAPAGTKKPAASLREKQDTAKAESMAETQVQELSKTTLGYPTQADGLNQSATGETQVFPSSLPNEEPEEQDETEKKERVLELYRTNKNIKEISKQLAMGQGEVKLIVDLYGK